MSLIDILLVIISSAGLLHGMTFAFYLSFIKKKKTVSNYLLSLILIFMAFRIGKSVMLNFGNELEPMFILAGLSFLLLIGPLLKCYVSSMTMVQYKLPRYFFLELLPFALLFLASFMVNANWYENSSKEVILVFASFLIFIYLHFAFYIFMSLRIFKSTKRMHLNENLTKAQKAVIAWLYMLIIGFALIWISFFLNIIEDTVPYIIGPIMYSIVVYFLSLKAFQLKITDIDGSVFKSNNDKQLFKQITKLIIDDKLYLESNISLLSVSKLVRRSTQKTSEVINQHSNHNFNDFINYYRIQEAKRILMQNESKKFTISSIAFDSGFNSLSSFNSAFRKFEQTTPSLFRKKIIG